MSNGVPTLIRGKYSKFNFVTEKLVDPYAEIYKTDQVVFELKLNKDCYLQDATKNNAVCTACFPCIIAAYGAAASATQIATHLILKENSLCYKVNSIQISRLLNEDMTIPELLIEIPLGEDISFEILKGGSKQDFSYDKLIFRVDGEIIIAVIDGAIEAEHFIKKVMDQKIKCASSKQIPDKEHSRLITIIDFISQPSSAKYVPQKIDTSSAETISRTYDMEVIASQ